MLKYPKKPQERVISLKKIIAFFATLLMLASCYCAEASGITVEIDGEAQALEVEPKIINGRTMVPVRAVFEALGAEVFWEPESRTVSAIKGDRQVLMTVGCDRLSANGLIMPMDVSPQIVDNRTFIPARFAAESMGASVSWDAESRTVGIRTDLAPDVRYYRLYNEGSYSVLCPDGWNIDISYANIVFMDNQGDKTHSQGLGIVSLSGSDLVNDSFSDTVSAKYDYLTSDCGAELSEFKNTTVNGCAAAMFKYRDSDGDYVTSYVISGTDRAYFVEFFSNNEGAFDEIYKNVLSSFTIN